MVSKWDWSGIWCEPSDCSSFTTKDSVTLLTMTTSLHCLRRLRWWICCVFPVHSQYLFLNTDFLNTVFLSPSRDLKGPLKGYFELETGSNTQIFQSIFSLPITDPPFLFEVEANSPTISEPVSGVLLAGQICTVSHFIGIWTEKWSTSWNANKAKVSMVVALLWCGTTCSSKICGATIPEGSL